MCCISYTYLDKQNAHLGRNLRLETREKLSLTTLPMKVTEKFVHLIVLSHKFKYLNPVLKDEKYRKLVYWYVEVF
jgi:hypothetical protein